MMPAVIEHKEQMDLLPYMVMPKSGDFRVLVTGWRYWPSQCSFIIEDVLWMVYSRIFKDRSRGQRMIVVDGACIYGGVDQYAFAWAQNVVSNLPYPDDNDVFSERHPAERGPDGRVYGAQRNYQMVKRGANLCLSFPGESFHQQRGGTYDCTMKAIKAGIPTWTFHWNEKYRDMVKG